MSSDSEYGSKSKRSQIKELRDLCKRELKAAGNDKKLKAEIEKKFASLEQQIKGSTNSIGEETAVAPQVASLSWSIADTGPSKQQLKRDQKRLAEEKERSAIREAHAGDEEYGRTELESISKLIKEESDRGKTKLSIRQIPPDGSCLFSAIACQLSTDAGSLRSATADFLVKNTEYYSNFIEENFEEYVTRLQTDAWGGELELAAIAEMKGCQIRVFRAQGIHIVGSSPTHVIRISHHRFQYSSSHYNAVL